MIIETQQVKSINLCSFSKHKKSKFKLGVVTFRPRMQKCDFFQLQILNSQILIKIFMRKKDNAFFKTKLCISKQLKRKRRIK